jgi:hypothetical protein
MDEDQNGLESEKMDMGSNKTFQKIYGWYVIVNKIAGNDFTKHEYVYNKTVMEVLNQTAFLIDYDKEQNRLQKEAQRQNK